MKSQAHFPLVVLSALLVCVVGLQAGPAKSPLSPEQAAPDPGPQAPSVGNEPVAVLIGFRNTPGPSEQALVRSHGGVIKYSYHLVPGIAASLPQAAVTALTGNPAVTHIEPDGKVSATDGELDNAWGVKRIGSGVMHAPPNSNTGLGVKVAIIDTGIDYTHPELDANYKGGKDFVSNDDDPKDDHGHGTHVAGIIAAEDNGEATTGVVGVAPGAYLYALKILDSTGSGNDSDLIAAMQWAVDNSMQVVNLSLGTPSDPGTLVKQAFDNAAADGIVTVAAAGNRDIWYIILGMEMPVQWPAAYDSVIAVSATTSTDQWANFSCSGAKVELAAPGNSIYSTLPGGYGTMSGTSMASPHVAGAAALVIKAGYSDVRGRLASTADDLGTIAGRDRYFGYGLVDADEAAATTTPPPPELTTITVSPSTVTLGAGQTQQFNAAGKDQYGNPISTGTITWQVVPSGVGTIDATGYFTAAVLDSTSSATVTATGDGGVSGTATVTVQAALVLTVIEVSPDAVTLGAGQTQQFTAAGKDQYGNPISTGTITWQVVPSGVGAIDSTGLFTAAAVTSTASTDVTATGNGGVVGTATVTVNPASVGGLLHVGNISLTREKVAAGKKGSVQYRVTATVLILDADGMAVSGADVSGRWNGGNVQGPVATVGGTATFTTGWVSVPKGTTYTFEITNVTKDGWEYDLNANTETRDSIVLR